MSQNRKWKSVTASVKDLCKILTPLAWLLAVVLHTKGNEGFPSILGNSAFWLVIFPSLACTRGCPRHHPTHCTKYNIVQVFMLRDMQRMPRKKQDVFKVNKINKNNGQRKAWEQQLGLDKD